MKTFVLICAAVALAGCGGIDRTTAHWSGKGAEVCQDGIVYLQFTSGTVVKIDQKTMTYQKC
jgi:hypothetical protein